MIGDIDTSERLIYELLSRKRSTSRPFSFNLSGLFLTNGIWRKFKPDEQNVKLPEKMAKCKVLLENFYKSKYARRSLRWAHHISTGDIQLSLVNTKDINYNKDYIFHCSGYQLIILQLFNVKPIYSIVALSLSFEFQFIAFSLYIFFCVFCVFSLFFFRFSLN